MPVTIKTANEIELMRVAGKILAKVQNFGCTYYRRKKARRNYYKP